jgi:hypothetical protein
MPYADRWQIFAGGLALNTPFGVIYSANITPDVDTGIGAWSEAEFLHAMHDGVDRTGRNLYPAFPFDHFTRVTDEDVSAIYAYIMTRDAVPSRVPANRLKFPMNVRPLLSGWKALYFDRGVYRPDPARSAEWNAAPTCRVASVIAAPAIRRATPWRRNQERSVRRRRSRRVARECNQCVVAGADAMDGRPVDPVPSPGSREPRHRHRPDVAGRSWAVEAPGADVRAMATYLTTVMAGAPASRAGVLL